MLEAESFTFPATPMVSAAPLRPLTSIAVFKNAVPALQAALGVALPVTPTGKAVNDVLYLWSGPDAWLAVGAEPAKLTVARPYAAITDQTDGRAVFYVAGPHATEALAKLVPIDLHESVFSPYGTALTLAGHIPVQLWREGEVFALACFRSFAHSLYASLIEACREFEG
jgi:sarcosine oxidase subunit gamma